MNQHAMIPGVVDGTVSVSLDHAGNVTLHVLVGDVGLSGAGGGDYVEIVLGPEHAGELGETLRGVNHRSQTVPCSVGVRFDSRPSALSTAAC
ncbi:hypothetical protein QQM39_28940 [Streptomyces sp. DT2A-34]|uniref:hypothetical protein n=1 Tax=Streptomyces sp. DT2A-34 TaxID=3051182 RepID=UPI00265C2EC4|nr:hypothetical protein [Streptomyces sp. DT2A-34]MDO0914711.1 hypothetical protein [Streptomyces sp. DT2A-34]